jgi:hypothetical protein
VFTTGLNGDFDSYGIKMLTSTSRLPPSGGRSVEFCATATNPIAINPIEINRATVKYRDPAISDSSHPRILSDATTLCPIDQAQAEIPYRP